MKAEILKTLSGVNLEFRKGNVPAHHWIGNRMVNYIEELSDMCTSISRKSFVIISSMLIFKFKDSGAYNIVRKDVGSKLLSDPRTKSEVSKFLFLLRTDMDSYVRIITSHIVGLSGDDFNFLIVHLKWFILRFPQYEREIKYVLTDTQIKKLDA